MITLTSFVEAKSIDQPRLSAARWAPSWATDWPVVEWARPIRPDGSAIKLRDFGPDPIEPYSEYMLDLFRSRWPSIRDWLADLNRADVVLACWCPFTKTASRQLDLFGSFHCHMGIVAVVLEAAGVEWQFGEQHANRMLPYHEQEVLL